MSLVVSVTRWFGYFFHPLYSPIHLRVNLLFKDKKEREN